MNDQEKLKIIVQNYYRKYNVVTINNSGKHYVGMVPKKALNGFSFQHNPFDSKRGVGFLYGVAINYSDALDQLYQQHVFKIKELVDLLWQLNYLIQDTKGVSCVGSYAQDKKGRPVSPISKQAVTWDINALIARVTYCREDQILLGQWLKTQIPNKGTLVDFNDEWCPGKLTTLVYDTISHMRKQHNIVAPFENVERVK